MTFSVSRILNAKTKKSDVFLTHFLNIDFIWGKSRFLKIDFLPFVSSVKIHVFNENIVCLYYGDFEIFNLVHFRYTTDHQISMLFNENVVCLYYGDFGIFQFCPFSPYYRSSKFHVLEPEKALLRRKNTYFWPKLAFKIVFCL